MPSAEDNPNKPLVDSSEPSSEDECTCGHSHEELPEEAKAILQAREVVDENPSEFSHPQKPFLGFEVDEGLHSLVENLWLMGLPTDFSCQGHLELCHPLLVSRDYYTQLMFLRVADATRFFGLLTELFGAGTIFGPEGFELVAVDGEFEDLLEEGEEPGLEFFRAANARARGEVRFHPGYIEHLIELLDGITNTPELDNRRSLLSVAEDLDEAYEALGVDDETRRLAELSCDCGEDH